MSQMRDFGPTYREYQQERAIRQARWTNDFERRQATRSRRRWLKRNADALLTGLMVIAVMGFFGVMLAVGAFL